jgi:DNA-binding transcriptional LysR family regulator
VELRQLRYFAVVAEELNFRRAATRLRIAGPSLSQQIKALERDLNVRLFDRDRRSVTLTPAGAALLPAARTLVDQADQLRRQAVGLSRSEPVRFGYVNWLPADLSERTAAVAQVHIDIWVLPSHVQAARVANGGLDLAICSVQTTDLDKLCLDAQLMRAEPLCAVCVGSDTSAVSAANTVVLLDADIGCWSSWNRYGQQFAGATGARTVRIDDGGIAGPMFFRHVRHLGCPVLSSPISQTTAVPSDLVQRQVTAPTPYCTWSLVSRRSEVRENVRRIIDTLTTDTVLPDLNSAWLPMADPFR